MVGDLDKERHIALSKLSEVRLNWEVVEKKIKPYEHRYDTALISSEDFWKSISKILKINNHNKVKKIYFGTKMKEKLNKNTVQIVKQLKKRYKVGILSNTNELDANINKKNNNFNLFSPVILSCEVGCRKPEKKIYQIALKKLKVKPSECVFIDDKKNNLSTAKELGIKTILFKSAIQLKKELNKLL